MLSQGLQFEHTQPIRNTPSSNATGQFPFMHHKRTLSFQSPAIVRKSSAQLNVENENTDDHDHVDDHSDDSDDSDFINTQHGQFDVTENDNDHIDGLSDASDDIAYDNDTTGLIQGLKDEF